MNKVSYWIVMWAICAAGSHAQEISGTATPLAALIQEAETHNPRIAAADHASRAGAQAARQVTTLPDPRFTVQSFSVGSPKPLAGFSNSDFAYLGFGASQELPYAGKLRLRGEVADREAAMRETQADLQRASVADQVKSLYLGLAYIQATLEILARSDAVLKPMIETGLARYGVGQGSQTEVLKAQIERTKILRETTARRAEAGQIEAGLKELLHRRQSSPDIVAEPLAATPLQRTAEEFRKMVAAENPAISVETASVRKEDARLRSARREGRPDFDVGYMFQQTGAGYRDYYMLTVTMRLPRRRRVEAGVAEAAESLEQSRQELDAEAQQQLAETQRQYVAATSTAELLTVYRDGLLPQARAAFEAQRTSYETGGGGLTPVLSSLLDVLGFEQEYQQTLLDHETALAKLETLTGATLR